jgi:hypothetical protein
MFKESVLEKIFVNMSKMTFFHRPGWSPDGSLLALANATNRQIPAVALVERNNWHGPGTFFVGHVGPVEAVRFCPRLFRGGESGMERSEMVCAVASQDGQVSVWSSSRTSPLLVLQDLFEHSVMDLAWTPDGTILVAVSYDGSAVAIKMSLKEFELTPLTLSEQAEYLKNVFSNLSAGSGESVQGYVESVKVIECSRENEQFISNCTSIKKDSEVQRNEFEQCTETVDSVNNIGSNSNSNSNFNNMTQLTGNIGQASVNNMTFNNLTPTIVNGKKRITPQLVNISPGVNSQPLSQNQSQNLRFSGGVRLRDEDFLIHRKLLERTSGHLSNRNMKENTENCAVFYVEEEEEIPGSICVPLSGGCKLFSVSIEVTNYEVNGRKSSSLIQFIQNNQIVWKERIRGTIYLTSGTRKYSSFAIKSENQKNYLLILTKSGRRFFPPISMDSRVIYLKICVREENLISITKNGTIKIWNLRESKLKFSDSSIGFCLPEIPVKFINFFNEEEEGGLKKIFYNENCEISFSSYLGIWTFKGKEKNLNINSEKGGGETGVERIEKLKLINLEGGCDRQISELEFELSLIFINLRNGKELNSSEISHFERTLAIYALKLVKEAKSLKAKELIDDLIELNCQDLIEGLLKPFFTSTQNSYSSSWQDFISESF